MSSSAYTCDVGSQDICNYVECLFENLKRGNPLCSSNRGRSTKLDVTLKNQACCLTIQVINNLVFRLETNQRPCCDSDISNCQKLAQHAFVHHVRKLGQMAVTLVMHAFDASHLTDISCFMNVKRRNKEYRQVHSQQHPCCDLSLCIHFLSYQFQYLLFCCIG